MSTQSLPVSQTATPSVRTGGLICLVAAVLGALAGVFLAVVPEQVPESIYSYPLDTGAFAVIQSLFALQHLGLVIGLLAVGRAGVVGGSRAGRWGLWAAVIGMILLAAVEIWAISAAEATYPSPQTDDLDVMYGVSTILIGVGLVVAGLVALRARRWDGWQRFVLLALGLWVFVPMTPAILGPFVIARLAIVGWMLLFAALGWALMRERT